jgi:hypothetical protein
MRSAIPIAFPEDESFDIGHDTRTGVAMLEYHYDVPFKFTGKINKVTFTLEAEHLTDEDRATSGHRPRGRPSEGLAE